MLSCAEESFAANVQFQTSPIEDNVRAVYGELESPTAIRYIAKLRQYRSLRRNHCINSLVMELQAECKIAVIFDSDGLLTTEVLSIRRVDDSKLACLKGSILHIDTHQKQM